MTYFLHQPAGIFLRSDNELLSVQRELAPANYMVDVTPLGEYYLQKVDNFTRPPKLYGTVIAKADRILSTFKDRGASTGVLLSGEMGSGKTMLLRELSLLGAEQGIPTIIVATNYNGPDFNKFIQSINVPAIVTFDEFEKVYDNEEQEALLTLLDGVFPTKKLFILTCNDMWKVNDHLINRPGRIYYHLQYKCLEASFVAEYCADVLKDQTSTEAVEQIASQFLSFNFDMLKALVEEMNRYGLSATDASEMLNMMPASNDETAHDFKVFIGEDELDLNRFSESYLHCNPLDGVSMCLNFHGTDGEADAPSRRRPNASNAKPTAQQKYPAARWMFGVPDLVKVNRGTYTFKIDGNVTIILSRRGETAYTLKHVF